MSTDLTTAAPSSATLAEQQQFALSLAKGDMLPAEYRNKPANVLIAMGLGQSMGLSPAESLYRIAVIKGKPTASGELIASSVRRAGHKLRVTTGPDWAEATIIRADDPDFPHTVRRDMAWAKSMGLDKQDNYRKQAATMLQWRAVSACARLACPEALYGVAYTPDEMRDMDAPSPTASVADFTPVEVEQVEQVNNGPTPEAVAAETDKKRLAEMWHASDVEMRKVIEARVAELDAAAEPEPADGWEQDELSVEAAQS
mgnify:CR=1 FL=1